MPVVSFGIEATAAKLPEAAVVWCGAHVVDVLPPLTTYRRGRATTR
jgi:hypothetical protein